MNYHSLPQHSASQVRKAAEGPGALWDALTRDQKTKAMDLGTAIHTLLLEPENAGTVVRKPDNPGFRDAKGNVSDSPWLTAEGKAWRAAHEAAGCLVIDGDMYDQGVVAAKYAERYLTELGYPRSTWIVETPIIHGPNRCKPDILVRLATGGAVVISVKTSNDISPAAWERSAITGNWPGYDIGEAHYRHTISEALDIAPHDVLIVHLCIQTTRGIGIRAYEMSTEVLDRAAAILPKLWALCTEVKAAIATGAAALPYDLATEPLSVITVPRWADRASAIEEVGND
jgi:hypothetical protein